jgi:hypothetical protein
MKSKSAAAWIGHALASSVSYVSSRRGHRGSALSRNSRRNSRCRVRPALILVALALTGCAGHVRYVSTYCVSQDQYAKLKHAEPGKIGSQLDGNAQHDLKLIAGNDLELRTFSDGLLGVIGSCVDPNTEARP